MYLLIDNMCHRKRNDHKIDMAIDTFWHESIVHKIGKVLLDESPMAYKSLHDIVDVIGDTVEILDIMKPLYNFKA